MVGYPKKGKGTRRNICIFFVWKGDMPVVCPEESPQYALPLPPLDRRPEQTGADCKPSRPQWKTPAAGPFLQQGFVPFRGKSYLMMFVPM